jgi:hypothetical protein
MYLSGHGLFWRAHPAAGMRAAGFIAVLIGNLITSFVILPLTIVLCRCGEMADAGDDDGMVTMLKQSLVKTLSNQIVWLPILG